VKEAGAYPSLIKIDTEGSDLSVLRGAVQTIAAHRPVVVFESFPDKERSHYWSFLKSMHYDIASLPYSLSDHSFIKEEDFCADKKANFIALPDGFLAPPIERVSGTRMIVSVTGLARTIWHEHYAPIIGTAQVEYMLEKFQSEKAIAAQIERESYRYFLLSEGVRGWIGYAAVIVQKDALFLSKLYILAGYRGRGHGARAIGFFEAMARKKKLLRICLTVNKRNAASIKAYEKLGFVISDSVVMDIGNGFVMDDYRMHKVLAP
jgi:GNAT superfamily N-acetyltransferase